MLPWKFIRRNGRIWSLFGNQFNCFAWPSFPYLERMPLFSFKTMPFCLLFYLTKKHFICEPKNNPSYKCRFISVNLVNSCQRWVWNRKVSDCRIKKRHFFSSACFSATLRKWGRGKRKKWEWGGECEGVERKGDRELPLLVVTHQKVRR